MASQIAYPAVGVSQTVARRVPAPSSRNSSSKSSKSSSSSNRRLPSASQIMKGINTTSKPDTKPKPDVDPYPGIEAILHKAHKMRPFKASDEEQRIAALAQILSVNMPHPDLINRMERDHAILISKWHANNDFLPIDKRQPFPYTRAREFRHLPEFKTGAKPVPDWLAKMNEEQASYEALPQESRDRAQALVNNEIVALRNAFKLESFDPYEQEWKAVNIRGYTSGNAYRAYRIFSKDQHDLLAAYTATPTHENKKLLLQHIQDHGKLILDAPKPDAPKPKSKTDISSSQPTRINKLHVGKATDV